MTIRRKARCALALACLLATLPVAAAEPIDVDALWRDFLAHATEQAYDGYDVMDAVGYDGDQVDADACKAQAAQVAKAVAGAPVSVGLHHVAQLCAEAAGDAATAAREARFVEALAGAALAQASDVVAAKPIRLLALQDAYVLAHVAGLEYRYAYFRQPHPDRYFPMVLVAWDADAGVERHLAVDQADVASTLLHDDRFAGYPYIRNEFVDAALAHMDKEGLVAGTDLLAVRKSIFKDATADRVAELRPAAERGGLNAAMVWAGLCDTKPYPGCADGLVDALLPLAEKQQAMAMALLAYAYAQGLGLPADPKAAATLLAAADRRWPQAGASARFASWWMELHDKGTPPPPVQAAIDTASTAGNRNLELALLQRRISGEDRPTLDARELALLAEPAVNGRGAGAWLLQLHYQKTGDAAKALEWRRRAATAGDPAAQLAYAWNLLKGSEGVAQDRAAGLAMMREAAQGGDATAMRYLAGTEVMGGRYHEAINWLMAAVVRGNGDALLMAAGIMANGKSGLDNELDRAVRVYRSLADGGMAEARRELADLALEGRGMKKDPAQAKAWLLQDAEKGDHDSEVKLGAGYLAGDFGKADEAEGQRWLERAMKGGNTDAYDTWAEWLIGKGDTESRRKGIELLRESVALGSDTSANNLAWALCTTSDASLQDGRAGLDVLAKVGSVDDLDISALDTLAACHATNGEYVRAAELQQEVIARFERLGLDNKEQTRRFRDRLALYRAGKTYRDPDQ